MASESTLADEKEKMSQVSIGFQKLFSKLNPLVAAHRAYESASSGDSGESDFRRRDVKVAHSIIAKTLKHLCNICKTLKFVNRNWTSDGNRYTLSSGCSSCAPLKVNVAWKQNCPVYRYTCHDSGHWWNGTQRAIFISWETGVIEIYIYKLPKTEVFRYATLPSMERANTRLALQWINLCRQSHRYTCKENVHNSLKGLKVIDCISGQICTRKSSQPYVALSYVWGSAPTALHPVIGKPTRSFPRTIEDAMLVANELKIPYLWVDRYCINQNNKQEKHIMITNMDKIYAGAELTIIAAAGSDPNYGLPGVSATKRRGISMHRSSHTSSVGCSSAVYEIAKSVWATRGWTYQEMLLSRRRLVFTNSQMVFQCCKDEFHEVLNIDLPRHLMPDNGISRFGSIWSIVAPHGHESVFPKNGNSSMDGVNIYRRIQEYTGRILSYPGDVLNAFEGIFGVFGLRDPKYGSHHFWGIPIDYHGPARRESFLAGLTWYVSEPAGRRPGCWPSWSWTSVIDRSITFDLLPLLEARLGVRKCTFTRTNGDKEDILSYVRAQRERVDYHPWIDFAARVLQGCTLNKENKSLGRPSTLVHPSLETKPIVVFFDVDILDQQLCSLTTAIYVCMKDSSVSFIIAQDTGAGSLKRIGYGRGTTLDWTGSRRGELPSVSKEWPRKKIRLV